MTIYLRYGLSKPFSDDEYFSEDRGEYGKVHSLFFQMTQDTIYETTLFFLDLLLWVHNSLTIMATSKFCLEKGRRESSELNRIVKLVVESSPTKDLDIGFGL